MGDRLTEIKDKFDVEFLNIPDRDIRWLLDEIETLRAAAHGDQVVIQRLRREVDHWLRREVDYWVDIAEDAQAKLARINLIEDVGNVVRTLESEAEIEALTRERDALAAKLAQAKHRATSRGGRVPK